MGSIISGPKTPTIQVVQSPAASATSSNTTSTASVTDTATSEIDEAQNDTQIASALRTDSLLRRSRGRFGTIASSFRGFFGDDGGDATQAPKTLLGE